METGSPSIAKVITMVLFALSCVGLLLFLWLSFGGEIPFNPKGYEFRAAFPNADQLPTQADVRIAGVNVGKVISKSLDPQGNRTIATLQIDTKYVPIHKDAKAILRTKTILGETYVEITPGSPNAPKIPDGGLLPRGQVQNAVQLSDIFNALDPKTRRAFQIWQQQLAVAIKNNDQNLNDVLGNLPQFAADATDILKVLDVQHSAVVRLVQNGGTVFAALSQDQPALRNLITSGETTFRTTAQNNNNIAESFHIFPTFLNETKATMARLKTFALNTDPLVKELVPVANQLKPTLQSVRALSPDLQRLFTKLGPLITASKTGLPAVSQVLNGAKPLLGSLGPFLEQLNPVLGWLAQHQQLTSDFISNGATGISAKTTSFGGAGLTCNGQPCGHYLRQFQPVGPETLAFFAQRPSTNRGNTYPPPLWLADPRLLQKNNLPSWDCRNTGAPRDGSVSAIIIPPPGRPACWVAPPLPGTKTHSTLPHIKAAHYSSK
jgi:phospholipid/cholesterol/gamma-HCH transport system substrate-binding protein